VAGIEPAQHLAFQLLAQVGLAGEHQPDGDHGEAHQGERVVADDQQTLADVLDEEHQGGTRLAREG